MTGIDAHLPALQVVVPLLVSALIVLLPGRLPWIAATAASATAFAIAIELTVLVMSVGPQSYAMGAWPAPFGIELTVDAFSALLLLVVTGASTLSLAAFREGIDREIELHRQPYFYAAWLLALAGLVGITVTGDAFNIFVFMEISSLASYVIVAGSSDRRALPAVFKYLIMGTIGATFYLIGIGLIYMMTGTLNLADMELRIHEVADQKPILAAAGFITVGLALKAAVFPLHVWLPNAYAYAPNAVTVFLAACATKVSIYVLLRFDFFVFQPNLLGHDFQFSTYLMPLAALAILVGSGVALFERNLKRLLAYSSVAQIGYILLGASLVTHAGLTASALHIFNHALAKGTLFLGAACLAYSCTGMRLENLAGVARRLPLAFAVVVAGGLSLIGVPATAGFISKWYLVGAAVEQGWIGVALIVVIAVGSLMAVVYIWRIVEVACFHSPDSQADQPAGSVPLPLMVTALVAAAANIYFGFVPALPVELSSAAAQILLGYST